MAAISPASAPRNTESRPGDFVYLPLAASTKIFQGTLVAKDANGRAVPASDTAGLRVVGLAEETVDNSSGSAGALSINVRLGVFKFANSADNAVTAAMIGTFAEVEADLAVASSSTNHVTAGRIVGVDTDGVWVDTRHAFYGPKAVVAAITGGESPTEAEHNALLTALFG